MSRGALWILLSRFSFPGNRPHPTATPGHISSGPAGVSRKSAPPPKRLPRSSPRTAPSPGPGPPLGCGLGLSLVFIFGAAAAVAHQGSSAHEALFNTFAGQDRRQPLPAPRVPLSRKCSRGAGPTVSPPRDGAGRGQKGRDPRDPSEDSVRGLHSVRMLFARWLRVEGYRASRSLPAPSLVYPFHRSRSPFLKPVQSPSPEATPLRAKPNGLDARRFQKMRRSRRAFAVRCRSRAGGGTGGFLP